MKSPVITIDGPSGTGKGTIAQMLAEALGWHTLDSGAIYRAVAWAALSHVVDPNNESALVAMIARCEIRLIVQSPQLPVQVLCDDRDITRLIRVEEVGMAASKISSHPEVRLAVLPFQREFRQNPGLITDGRDMGTVVFPDADLKIYLDADPAVRAARRHKQLYDKGIHVSLRDIETGLSKRDVQDITRQVAPLKPAVDAYTIDTTHISAEQVFAKVMAFVREFVL